MVPLSRDGGMHNRVDDLETAPERNYGLLCRELKFQSIHMCNSEPAKLQQCLVNKLLSPTRTYNGVIVLSPGATNLRLVSGPRGGGSVQGKASVIQALRLSLFWKYCVHTNRGQAYRE